MFLLLASLSACSKNRTAGSEDTTTISGTITISAAAGMKPSYSAGGRLSAPAGSMGTLLAEATVELYDADKPDWLYPVAVALTDGAGNYYLSKLANAAGNGNAYHDQNPIPSGNYTIVAYKYDANIGKLYVAVQAVVKNFKGAVKGNNLVALDQGVEPVVQDIAGLPKNMDGTFGSPANVLPENAAIQVTFNTAMARLTVLGAISIKDRDGNTLQGTWRVSADLLSATFCPASQLNAGGVYTITVLGGGDAHAAQNLYGNPIPATVTGTFGTTGGDVTPPNVALLSPLAVENVPVETPIQMASDKLLDVTALAVSSSPSIGDKPAVQYAGKTGIASRPYVYTIIPDGPLQFGTRYEFTISGIKDLAENSADHLTFAFTTIAQTQPTVLSVTPLNGALGVDVNTAISASFSTDMDALSLTGPATVFTVNGITGTVVYDADARKATFTPSAPLAQHTLYTATITVAARDAAGVPLAQDYTWSFTTMSLAHEPGDLDRAGFGSEGTIILKLGDISFSSLANAIAVDADGKSVVGGYSYSGNVPQFTLARLKTDGSLDTTFGSNGIVVTAFSTGSGSGIAALAIQPDGKIVAAGNAPGGFGLVRYNVNGSLDTTFGTNGKLVTEMGLYAGCHAIGLQSDGKIVIAGTAYGSNHDVVVVRYTTGGSLDMSFNLTGKVMTDVGGGHDQAFALAVQGDGGIVVGGYADTSQGRNFAVLRYQGDGVLDSGFGTGGKVTTPLGSSQINTLGIQADGKIVAAGYQATGNFWQVAVVRYNADGSLDSTFDGDGIVMTAVGNWRSAANALALLPDGRILIAGYSGTTTKPTDMLLIRYNPDGSPDAVFGSGGSVVTDIAGGADSANAIAIQPDGNIVAAGQAFVGQSTGIAVARYLSN